MDHVAARVLDGLLELVHLPPIRAAPLRNRHRVQVRVLEVVRRELRRQHHPARAGLDDHYRNRRSAQRQCNVHGRWTEPRKLDCDGRSN